MEPDSTEPDGPHQPPEPQQNNALHIRLKALQGRFNNALPEAATLSPRHQDNISKVQWHVDDISHGSLVNYWIGFPAPVFDHF